MDVAGNPALRHFTPAAQHELIDGLVHNLSRYQQEVNAATVSHLGGIGCGELVWKVGGRKGPHQFNGMKGSTSAPRPD